MTELRDKWEYHITTECSVESLNRLGEDGWELVGIAGDEFFLKRSRLSFKEQVTLDQKQRYFQLWDVGQSGEGTPR